MQTVGSKEIFLINDGCFPVMTVVTFIDAVVFAAAAAAEEERRRRRRIVKMIIMRMMNAYLHRVKSSWLVLYLVYTQKLSDDLSDVLL